MVDTEVTEVTVDTEVTEVNFYLFLFNFSRLLILIS